MYYLYGLIIYFLQSDNKKMDSRSSKSPAVGVKYKYAKYNQDKAREKVAQKVVCIKRRTGGVCSWNWKKKNSASKKHRDSRKLSMSSQKIQSANTHMRRTQQLL